MRELFNFGHRIAFFGLVSALCTTRTTAQDYVTPDQFAFTVEADVPYGIAPNYLGVPDTLLLDIYKPIGNPDDQRPLLVCAHGGSWLGGCKDDPAGIVPLILQFVKRGYVVASINYRLGWHKDDYVNDPVAGYQPSLWPETYRAFYAADTLEVERAIYRGMQDMKGAIRFMKGRAEQDSVCAEKVFVAGESAGAFVALATAFLDRAEEKPTSCGALPDAPMPWFKCANLTGLNCEVRNWEVDSAMLARPDLGDPQGQLNLNGTDASVKGVAGFYGGVPLDAFALDWWQGADTPSVYLFHQSCDGVVLNGIGRPYTTMSAYCNLGSTAWHYNLPIMAGSGSIVQAFAGMNTPPSLLWDPVPCDAFNPDLALFECARYADNGSYHSTVNLPLRAANLSGWWAPVASAQGQCISTATMDLALATPRVYPIPASTHLFVPDWSGAPVQVYGTDGRCWPTTTLDAHGLDVIRLPNGPYILRNTATGASLSFNVVH